MSAETADILDRAADVIERNGWYQDFYFDLGTDLPPTECPVCLLGAISIAMGNRSPKTEVFGSPAEIAMERYLGVVAVADWNDDANRTVAEVLAALRGAAQAEREAAS